MAILPMKRIHIYALSGDRRPILEALQQFGSVQVNNLQADDYFIKKDITEDLTEVERDMAKAEEALSILESYSPENKSVLESLRGRQELTLRAYEDFSGKKDEFLQKQSTSDI